MPSPKYYEKLEEAQAKDRHKPVNENFNLDLLIREGFLARITQYFFEHTRWPYWFLRKFLPILRIGRIAIVTRYADVRKILTSPEAFEVPFGREMTELVVGQNAVLGMNDLAEHKATLKRIHQVFQESDLLSRIQVPSERYARDLLDQGGGHIDVVKDLFALVPTKVCRAYYGLDIEDEDAFSEWTVAVSTMLFGDPFGDPTTRSVALAGGTLLRKTIMRSIDKAHADLTRSANPTQSDTIAARLVALQRSGDSTLTDDVIRSILYGMVIGFVPTCTLAAGNVWQVLLERSDAMEYCREAARRGDDVALGRGLLEAMRLRPPLNPGVFRYVKKLCTLGAGQWGERTLPVGTTVFVATASAMNDERVIAEPDAFLPQRGTDGSLLFGLGLHWCVGQRIAEIQISQMFKVLLSQPNLRPAEGYAGKLIKVGPFPRAQIIDYGFCPPVQAEHHQHSLITICESIEEGVDRGALKKTIAELGNPAVSDIDQKFRGTDHIHFASMSVIEGEEGPDYVLLEMSADGGQSRAIEILASRAGDILAPIFATAAPSSAPSIKADLAGYLARKTCKLGLGLGSQTGLAFCGIPGLSLDRIRKEKKLEEFANHRVADLLKETAGRGRRPLEVLHRIRAELSQQGCGWALQPEPMPFVDTVAAPWMAKHQTFWSLALAVVGRIPWLSLSVAVSVVLLTTWLFNLLWPDAEAGTLLTMLAAVLKVLVAAALSILTLALALGAFVAILALLLQRREKRDPAIDRDPDPANTAALMAIENAASAGTAIAQNHMTAVSTVKLGSLRKLTLHVGFYVVGLAAKLLFRPGFLGDVGTIHFARWVQLPGTRNLVFLSNYDGSWESYLEDFITKANRGLNSIWSNTTDYPRTRLLFFGGATDGDRFKRWARRQQVPTLFWFVAEPGLSTDRKRTNALIRDGIARARTLSDAQAWLDLFASVPRPTSALEFDEIQSLAFGGMGRLSHAAGLVVHFPSENNEQNCRKWLSGLMPGRDSIETYSLNFTGEGLGARGANRLLPPESLRHPREISFGDRVPQGAARIIALSAPGLSCLGVARQSQGDGNTLTSFPAAFVCGMNDPARSRILDDIDDSAPMNWSWGGLTFEQDPSAVVHAVLMLYAHDEKTLMSMLEVERHALAERQLRLLKTIFMQPLNKNPAQRKEPFGFLDGISQPLIRGTSAFHRNPSDVHTVAPGELILGYPDNRGFFPPSPQILAKNDPKGYLPSPPAGLPARYPHYVTDNRPRFSLRDIGFNGSYLVIRQIEQNVDGFNAYLESEAQRLNRQYSLCVTPEWVAAKLVGRWKDGSSFVREPELPLAREGTEAKKAAEDSSAADGRQHLEELKTGNDFLFGVEDPQGLRCPYGSHIRRANPRESFSPGSMEQLAISNRHRILRVGRPYLSEDDGSKPRGIFFMCLNADIDRQFEFIQQNWISGRSFHGLREGADVISATASKGRRATIQLPWGPVQLDPFEPFVKVVGGGYFFLPSRRALRYLSST